jgi:hypothetical protein
MATLVLASTEKERQKILDSMGEKTRVLAVEGFERLRKLQATGVLIYHQLGTSIQEICNDETLDEITEITKLARYWGIDNTTKLYEMRNAALCFTREYLEEQLAYPLVNGQKLTFEHFKALRRVSNEKERNVLLKQTRKLSWTANELSAEIRGTGVTTTKRSGGRNPSIPSSSAAIVKKCYTLSQQLYRYLDAVGEEAENRFEELPADEATEKLLEGMTDAIDMLDTLRLRMAYFDAVLKVGVARVNAIVANTEVTEDLDPYKVATSGTESERAAGLEEIFSSVGHEPKKRGRPKGSKNKVSEEEVAVIVEANRRDLMESPQASIEDLRERTVASVDAPTKRGRPKGSKNKVSEEETTVVMKKRGRPKGSKNKATISGETVIVAAKRKRGRPRASTS